MIRGACHCGNLQFELRWPEHAPAIPARACGCSFCQKHGGVWTSHPGASLSLCVREPDALFRYQFGTRTATFHVCTRCGVVPVVTSELDARTYAVVNVNTFENVERSALQLSAADFEGEGVEARLARRRRNWISDVRWLTGLERAAQSG